MKPSDLPDGAAFTPPVEGAEVLVVVDLCLIASRIRLIVDALMHSYDSETNCRP